MSAGRRCCGRRGGASPPPPLRRVAGVASGADAPARSAPAPSVAAPAAPAAAAGSTPAAASAVPPVLVRYGGARQLAVRGAVTGRIYRFAAPGAVLPVDPRDLPGMAGVPHLGPAR